MPTLSSTTRIATPRQSRTGQSLVEFVLVMPILVLLAVAGVSFGIATHQAHMVADAVQFPAAEKLEMANKTGAIGAGDLQGYMNGGNLKDNFTTGGIVNSVNLVDSGQYNSIMVGSRQATPPLNIAAFTIRSGQVINKNLIQAANSGAEVRPYNTPWVPGGTMNAPPWGAGGTGTDAAADPAAGGA